jgi:arsenate reductase
VEPQLTVYEKRTCTTCKRLSELLTERGVDFSRVDYHVEPLPEEKIRSLLSKAGIGPREALRTKEPLAQSIPADATDDDVIALMAAHPELLQRPVVERGDRAVLARPVERVLELLD